MLHPHDPGAPECGASLLPLARASSRDPELTSLSPCSSSARRPHTSTPTSERLGRPLRPPARAPPPSPAPLMDPCPLTPSHTPYHPLQPRLSRPTHTHTPPYVDTLCARPPRPRLVYRPRLFAPLLALFPPPPRTLSLIPSSPPTPLLLCYYSVRAGVEHDTPFTDCSTSTRGTRSRAVESDVRERPGHKPCSMTTDSTAQNVQLQAPRTRSSPRSPAPSPHKCSLNHAAVLSSPSANASLTSGLAKSGLAP